MIAIPLGPLALPAAPLLLLAAASLAVWLANRVSRRAAHWHARSPHEDEAGNALLQALGVGLVAARLVHLGQHLAAYGADPWAALDLRDGGWHAPAGWAAGLAWVAWRALRRPAWHPAWRQALAIGTAFGLATWTAGTAWLASQAPPLLPDLVLTRLVDGAPVRLREAAARRPVVLNLWASWCGPCRQEMPVLAAARRRHPDVLFVFANQGESPAAVRAYLEAQGLDLAVVLLDAGSRLGPAVGSPGLPTTVIYNAEGRRVDAHLGALNAAALAAKLELVTRPPGP